MNTKSKRTVKPGTKQSLITYGLLIFIFAAVNIFLAASNSPNRTLKGVLVTVCAYAMLAVSLNLTVGFLGELSLGQAGFMYIGAFSSVLFSTRMEETIPEIVRFPIALIVGGIFAAIFGILIGIPVLRLKGDYLAIVTLAFGEIIKNVLGSIYVGKDANGLHIALTESDLNLALDGEKWINGPNGINNIPKSSNFTIAFILLFITVVIAYNFANSRTGRAVMSIRDNRIAAESIGLNITKYKLITFGLTAFLAGVAGALYSHDLSSLQPQKFDYNLSILILVFVVLGGIGSIRGSVIAAIVLHCLPELILRDLSEYRMLIYAVILIAMMLFRSNSKIASNLDKVKSLIIKDKTKKGEVQ